MFFWQHITKQELPISNGLESFFHEHWRRPCSQELKRKCPELPAGQFFSGAQIPSCIFVDVWPIDFIRGILVEE